MIKRMNEKCRYAVSVSLMIALVMTGCSWDSDSKTEVTKDSDQISEYYPDDSELSESEKFDEFSKNMFLGEIVDNTIDLHYTIAYPENYGIEDYEVELGSYEASDAEDAKKELEELQKTLQKFSRDDLTKEQQIAYDIMDDYVELELDSEDLYYYGEVFSPLTGFHTQLPVLLAEYTFRCERDVTDYLTLLSQIDDTFSSYFVYEQEKADAGLGMPDFALEDTIEACEEFTENPKDCYLIDTFSIRIAALDDISDEKKEEYKKQNRELVLGDVMDAYRNLAKNLETLKGKGKNEAGLCNFDKGKEYYEYLVRSNVGSDMSIAEIKKTTEEFIDTRMSAIFDTLYDDMELYYMFFDDEPLSTKEPDEIMEELIEKCQKDFGNVPDVNYEIKNVPIAMEEHLNPAFYLTPPIDDPNDNVIYINQKYEDREDLYPLLAHEGYPGHLYQIVSSASYERPLVRNLFSFSGYTEGFATYAELYSYTLADVDADYARLKQYDNSVTLALSAYIDICVNYYGWDEEDVYEYLEETGMGDEETAKEVFQMVVEEPSEYLEYYVGFLEFMNLRNEAKEKLGSRFNLRDFHEFLISVGPAPFYLIEDYMQEWIEEQK